MVIVIALLPVTAYLVLQIPSFQLFAAQKAAKVLSNNLNTQVSVEKVYFLFFKKLVLKNVRIMSTPSDTLLDVHKLSITFSHFNPFSRKAMLQKTLLQGGVLHLEIEESRQTNLERVFKIEKKEQAGNEPKDSTLNPLIFTLKDLSLRDFRFTLKDEQRWRGGAFPNVMDFLNLDLVNIDLDATKISLERDTLFCTLKNLTASEKTGYKVEKMCAHVAISGTGVRITELALIDQWSDIRADTLYMRYNSARDFRTFVDSVRLEAHFNNAFLSFRSLAHYAPAIENNQLATFITGHVEGPVRHLRGKDVYLKSVSGATTMEADFRIKGLPNASLTTAFLDIHKCTSQVSDIAEILYQINGMDRTLITQFIPLSSSLQLEGQLAGLLTNFVANGTLSTDVGEITFDAVLYQERGRGFHINGHLGTQDLHLENVMGEPFGALTMRTHTHATLRNATQGGFQAKIDSLRIDKMVINNYPFSHIIANGKYEYQRFDGRVVCRDPNLNFIFQGLADLNYQLFRADQASRYDFHADIAYADLSAIGIDRRDSVSNFSGSLRANFQRSIANDVIGSITIQNGSYSNSTGAYNLGTIHIDSHIRDSAYRFTLSAPFAKADYVGSEGIPIFVKDLRHNALSRYLPNCFPPPQEVEHAKRQYRLDVTVYDMLAIGQIALPGLYIAPETQLTATLSSNNTLSCSLRSRYIRYNEQKAGNIRVDFSGNASVLHSTILATELQALGIQIGVTDLRLSAAQDRVDLRFEYADETGQRREGTVNANVFLGREEGSLRSRVDVLPSFFVANNAVWELGAASILLTNKEIHFDRMKLYNANQSLTVEGTLAKERSDTLHIALNQFDISLFNLFLEKTPYRFAGTLTGGGKVVDFYQNRQFSVDLTGSDVLVNEQEAGEISVTCLWDHVAQCFQIGAQNRFKGKTPATLLGYYYPENKFLTFDASLQNFSVSYFQPFLRSLVSNLNGDVSGKMCLNGTVPNFTLATPRPQDRVEANNVAFTVNYTNVPYVLNGKIALREDGFFVQNGTLTDRNGNKGVVNGGMEYHFFKDIGIDAWVDFTNMHCLATKEKDNELFYGDVYATGRLNAVGNLKQIGLDIVAKTDKNSIFHIPLSNTSEAKQSTLLTFATPPEPDDTTHIDPFDSMERREEVKKSTQVAVTIKADVTPDAEVLIEINKSTGNVISGFGSGTISIGVDPVKTLFDIYGDYTLSSGDYQFVLQGIWSRKFFVVPGGKITFNGDLFKTNLDLTAAYRTKASLNTLLANSSATGGLRDVECLIRMNGNILNPNLGFDIEIADLAPEVRSRVQAAFTPEDKKIRQFMSLLVSGGFMPDQMSGIVNNTSILYSNATDILTNQLNNIFGQLNIPLDVGFNYQPAGNEGRDVYDVAVSTQLFNNRLVVNGNLGNAQASGTTGDVSGNIDIEVKITDNGNFRIKAFSHSADQYSNYKDLNYTQRNGAGIIYQEEFNTFRELFNRMFGRKKKRMEAQ